MIAMAPAFRIGGRNLTSSSRPDASFPSPHIAPGRISISLFSPLEVETSSRSTISPQLHPIKSMV